jgi:cell pole-organizing protein PopZ
MTPKSDHDEDMSMEEILASIRKFVTDNPPEDPNKQRVYSGDLSESVVIPPAGHMSHPAQTTVREEREDRLQISPTNRETHPPTPREDLDILELNSPLSTGTTPSHQTAWTPPSRTPLNKRILEESIMTLTNPIDSKKTEKPTRAPMQGISSSESDETLGSSHAVAASASSLARLAQASKSIPKKAPSLADQRGVTLDQLIQDLIRPMIKQWIDTHLPSLVEEMVAKEIKRITKHLG